MRLRIVIALLLVCGQAEAATLYVNNSGSPVCSDATVKASNAAGSPWCTIARAAWGSTSYGSPSTAQAADAGDTVLITAGVYSENGLTAGGGAGRFTVSLNPANSGTAGNLITFRGVGNVYVRLNDTYRGAMIGCDARNYIVWDHLIIDDYYGGSTSDTGPVVFTSNNHCQLINSEVIAHAGSYFWGYPTFDANYRGVSLEPDADFNLIKNNRIHGFTGAAAGVLSYDSNDNIIEHNNVYANKIGIYFKGLHVGKTMDRNIIRYNYVYDNTHRGIQLESASDSQVYQNLVTQVSPNGLAGIFLGSLGGAHGSRVFNNTVYTTNTSSEGAVVISGTVPTNNDILNNIFSGVGAAFNYGIYDGGLGFDPAGQDIVFNRNQWYGHSNHVNISGGNISFANWKLTPYFEEANSQEGDPLFVSAGTNFKLQGGSPALTLGRALAEQVTLYGYTLGDTIPAGAYITGNEVMGIESTSTPSTTISGTVTFSGGVRVQ